MFGFGEDTVTCTLNNTLSNASYWLDYILRPNRDSILISCIQPIIASIGIFLNLAFIAMVWTRKNLHSVTNTYLVHLAIADSMFVFFKTVVNFISYFKSPWAPNWAFLGPAGCIIDKVVPSSCYYASLLIVTLVTLDRYLAICFPFKHRQIASHGRARKLLMLCWMTAILSGSVHAFEGVNFNTFCMQPSGRTDIFYKFASCSPFNRKITNTTSYILEFGSFVVLMSGKVYLICSF